MSFFWRGLAGLFSYLLAICRMNVCIQVSNNWFRCYYATFLLLYSTSFCGNFLKNRLFPFKNSILFNHILIHSYTGLCLLFQKDTLFIVICALLFILLLTLFRIISSSPLLLDKCRVCLHPHFFCKKKIT